METTAEIEKICRPFLLHIANEEANLLKNQENRKVFEQYAEQLLKEWKKHKSALPHRYAKIIIKLYHKSLKNKRLRDEEAGPPKRGYVWYGPPSPHGGFWIHPNRRIKTLVSPKFRIRFSSRDKLPKDGEKRLEIFFLWLISIHDRMRPDGIYLIYKGEHPELLAELNLCVDYVLAGGHPVFRRTDNSGSILIDECGKELVKLAFEEVKAHLASTKQNDSPKKVSRGWNRFLDLYEKTLKAFFDSLLGKYGPKEQL
jgi:hypothetical protein